MSRTSSSDSERADPVMQWLRRHGFTANPFAEWEASKEEWLQRYFVSLPFFDKLYGDPEHPVTTFLFAGRGCGKSAHRIMIQNSGRPHNPLGEFLAIPYTDFSSFLNESGNGLVQPTLRQHLSVILRVGLEALVDELLQRPQEWQTLSFSSQSHLKRLVQVYASEQLNRSPVSFESEAKSFWSHLIEISPPMTEPMDTFADFRRMVQLVSELRMHSIYVLVDGLDEYAETVRQPEMGTNFLLPLILTMTLMEMPHVAFKFFLPRETGMVLRNNRNMRLDRLENFNLEWNPDRLKMLLGARLRGFNTKSIDSLGALAEQDLREKIDDEIVRYASSSPRGLVILGNLLFTTHCETNDKLLLCGKDWETAKDRFRRDFRKQIIAAPLLRIDKKRIFIGEYELDVKLTPKEFGLLSFLYQAHGATRSEDQIREAVFEAKTEDEKGGVSDEAIDSLVSRLRKKLKDDSKNPTYLITEHGVGYRLVNTE